MFGTILLLALFLDDYYYRLIGCICNNSTSTSYAAYAGLRCESIATDYCVFGVSVSYAAFCVNYGICNDIVIDNSKGHPGCTCPPQYEGPHCEYARGSTPVWVIDPTKASEEVRMEQSALSPGLIIVITLFSIAAFAGMISLIFFIIQKGHFFPLPSQRTSANTAYFKALNQELDADGSGIRETVEMQESIRSGEARAKKVGESPMLNDVDII